MSERRLSTTRPQLGAAGRASKATALDEQPVILTTKGIALPPLVVDDQIVILEMPKAPPRAVSLPEAPSEPEVAKKDWSGYVDLLVCAVLLGG